MAVFAGIRHKALIAAFVSAVCYMMQPWFRACTKNRIGQAGLSGQTL